jgi:UDP-2,4-diacetamido-2,4,6-trideoxy-beta-L-altropyranose hydrolase
MNVAFRVDASRDIGSGHMMRCLALADGLHAAGAEVRFLCRPLGAHLASLITERGFALATVDDTPGASVAALAPGCDWLVVDHYALDARWESAMRARARRILAIDDLADRPHDCDVLLDQNLVAGMEQRYGTLIPAASERLLGPRYALLRSEFAEARAGVERARAGSAERPGPADRLLISFGGGDAANHTALALEAVVAAGRRPRTVDVVIGGDHPRRAEIEAACRAHGFQCHVQTQRMAELMAAADVAIGAGGSTTWERCCLGLPAIVIPIASNQEPIVDEAARRGLVYSIGTAPVTVAALAMHLTALVENAALRELLSRNGMCAVDGRGVGRVVRALLAQTMHVREAVTADSSSLFEWRNHDDVRGMSWNQSLIERPAHDAWVTRVLADPDRLLLIGEVGGAAVGVVRFDITGAQAEVSIYRVPGSRPGLGTSLLIAAERWLRRRRPDVTAVVAGVRAGNERSSRLFESAGYDRTAVHYEKRWSGQ